MRTNIGFVALLLTLMRIEADAVAVNDPPSVVMQDLTAHVARLYL